MARPASKQTALTSFFGGGGGKAASLALGDKVSIEYDGEWFAGEVSRLIDVGIRVVFDVDGSGTVRVVVSLSCCALPSAHAVSPLL